MREPIEKYFRVGTIQWMSHPARNVVESIRDFASDDFFSALEIRHFEDSAQREEARQLLAQSHMWLGYGAQPTLLAGALNPNAVEESERIRAEKALTEAVDEAAFLGASGIAFLAGKWTEEQREAAYAQLLKTTRNVCDYAAEKGMHVELEVFDYNMDKAALIGPAPYAARFASDVRMTHANFGLLVDLSHFPTTYETSRFAIRTMRSYITHFHIGNAVVKPGCAGYGDQHPRFGYPNSANDVEQLVEFFRVLRQEGFFDAKAPYVLSLEVKPMPGEDEDVVLANTKRVIRRAWALLEDGGAQ
ncbi:sugar phosphate isomerase/epimerase [Ruthenibacterium sp. CLA-JM-H11]|uniref:Sugar phosphate isomerase/epimerase n=1 Tax=Ruthenibacterium intestinale TaxID=3133163 RepID=A0ABV1GG82_9FIRM